MELDAGAMLTAHPEMTLFAMIGVGYLLGKIGVGEVKLGPSIGVLFVALLCGHLGFELSPLVGTIGFIFFIYSVGYEAGPRFFATFKVDGIRYVQIGLVVALSAIGVALLARHLFKLEPGFAAGVLAGGLTSTPTLAAAQDALRSGLARLPEGYDLARVDGNIAVGYAVTYVFGLVGLILFLQLLPRLLKIDLPAEAREAERRMDVGGRDTDDELGLGSQGRPSRRIFQVTAEASFGKSLDDLKFLQATGSVISQLMRGEETIQTGPETVLEHGDRVAVLGYRENHLRAAQLLGEEILDPVMEQSPFETRQIHVHSREVAGKTLRDTGITNQFACIAHRVRRGGIELPVSLEMKIQRGDYLVVSGSNKNLQRVITHLGVAETPIHQTDLLTFALGIAAGLLIGYATVTVGKLPIGIGAAGGLLVAGLLVGQARVTHPLFGRVPPAARYILMELGLMLFLAGVGARAGSGLVEGLQSSGLSLFVSGVFVTLLPPLAGILYGLYVLKMNPAILFGALTGGMTSTPALGAVTRQAQSNMPAMGYVGVYAFANIVLTLAGQIIMVL